MEIAWILVVFLFALLLWVLRRYAKLDEQHAQLRSTHVQLWSSHDFLLKEYENLQRIAASEYARGKAEVIEDFVEHVELVDPPDGVPVPGDAHMG